MKKQRNIFQVRERDKTPKELCEVEISNLPNKQFKVMTVKMYKSSGEYWKNSWKSSTKRKCKEEPEMKRTITAIIMTSS